MAPRTLSLPVALSALGVLAAIVGLELGFDTILGDASLRGLVMMLAVNVVIAISLNVINGMAGQFSIGHVGFVGMGAYSAAVVATHLHHALGGGAPDLARSFVVVPLALLCSASIAGVFGLLLGLPSLRLKGDYLAIVTLGFAEIFRLVIATAPNTTETVGEAFKKIHFEFSGRGVVDFFGGCFHILEVMAAPLGGSTGYQGLRGGESAGGSGVPLYAGPLWIFGLTAILCVLAWRLKFSGWGRALRALREDEIAAAAVGVDPTRYKVTSFVIAAIGGGIAGGMMALMRDGSPTVQPDTFNFQASFDAIVMVIIGGSGSVTGSILGAAFFTLSIKVIEFVQGLDAVRALKEHAEWLDFNALRLILYAGVLIALMIFRPEGILGERELFQTKPAPRDRKRPPKIEPGDVALVKG